MLQPEEVVEVFLGDTLEEAMAYAVAALGPDLSVRRARKVRKGMQGLVGRDKYEVLAAPAVVESTDAVESAFDALLSMAEEQEAPGAVPPQRGRKTTRPHPAAEVAEHVAPAPAPPAVPLAVTFAAPVVAEHVAELPAPAAADVLAPAAAPVAEVVADTVLAPDAPVSTAAEVVVHEPAPAPVPAPAAPARAAKKPAAKRAPARKKTPPAPSGWSLAALEALGLPAVVLDALPADEPADDLAWVVALAVALSSVLPAPAALGEANPVVVNGHGFAGVLGLLDAAARGLTPGTITVGDRTAAATATELALAVRAAVVG